MSFSKLLFNDFNGFAMPKVFSEENIKSSMRYKPQKDELFVVGYPRVGSTWIETIVLLIARDGEPFENMQEKYKMNPFIDMFGTGQCSGDVRPIVIKTNLPYDLVAKNDESTGKYIVVLRNPKDVCVSYYLFYKSMHGFECHDMPFDYFFDEFINGRVGFDDYFKFINSWIPHKDDANVKVIIYEEMKCDHKNTIKEIAKFMGQQYYDKITADDSFMEKVFKYSTFDYMYKQYNNALDSFFKRSVKSFLEDPNTMEYFKDCVRDADPEMIIWPEDFKVEFVRKGQVNDWKNFMTDDQSQKMNHMIMQKLKNTNLIEIWKKHNVFD